MVTHLGLRVADIQAHLRLHVVDILPTLIVTGPDHSLLEDLRVKILEAGRRVLDRRSSILPHEAVILPRVTITPGISFCKRRSEIVAHRHNVLAVRPVVSSVAVQLQAS
jgi:hypothetical protein